jgi:hypothetical protein
MNTLQNSNVACSFPSIEYIGRNLVAQVIEWKKKYWTEDYLIGRVTIRSVVEQMKQYLTRLDGKLQNW